MGSPSTDSYSHGGRQAELPSGVRAAEPKIGVAEIIKRATDEARDYMGAEINRAVKRASRDEWASGDREFRKMMEDTEAFIRDVQKDEVAKQDDLEKLPIGLFNVVNDGGTTRLIGPSVSELDAKYVSVGYTRLDERPIAFCTGQDITDSAFQFNAESRLLFEKIESGSTNFFASSLLESFSYQNQAFELGEPMLVYHPYSVSADRDHIMATDLHSGERLNGKRHLHPELAGYQSPVSAVSERGSPIAFGIGVLLEAGGFSNSLSGGQRTIVRKPVTQSEGEILYYPTWEVPMRISRRVTGSYFVTLWTVSVRKKWLFMGKAYRLSEGEHTWQVSGCFETAGAMVYDTLDGALVKTVTVESYLDRDDKSSQVFAYDAELTDRGGDVHLTLE